MKKLISMLPLFLLSGCAMGINHNVAVLDGKTYLLETPTYATPILPVYEWSGPTSFKELHSVETVQIEPTSQQTDKELWREIIQKCAQMYPRKAIDREKCFEREVNAL